MGIEKETVRILMEAIELLDNVYKHRATEDDIARHLANIVRLSRHELRDETVLKNRISADLRSVFRKKDRTALERLGVDVNRLFG